MTTPDYSVAVSLMPLNWEADDEAFRYLLDIRMARVVVDFMDDGNPLPPEDIVALHEAAWAHRAKYTPEVRAMLAKGVVPLIPVPAPFGGKP